MGPFTAINGEGAGFSFSQMIEGRPADNHYYTLFFPPNATRNDKSLETLSNVEGMQFVSTQLVDGSFHGNGKMILTRGRIFIGQFKEHKMS